MSTRVWNIIMKKILTKEGVELNKGKEAGIVYTAENLIMAKSAQYYVSVVKVNNYYRESNYVVIVNEENLQGRQREVILKKFENTSHLARFLLSVVPQYLVEKSIVKETYDSIQELISK